MICAEQREIKLSISNMNAIEKMLGSLQVEDWFIHCFQTHRIMYPISGRNQEYVNIYLGWIRCKQNDYGEDVAKNGSIMCKTGHWQEQAFEFRHGWILQTSIEGGTYCTLEKKSIILKPNLYLSEVWIFYIYYFSYHKGWSKARGIRGHENGTSFQIRRKI